MAGISDTTSKLNQYLKTPQHRSYFLIFATVIFVFIMVVFGVLPAYSAFTLQGEENAKRQSAIDQLVVKLSTLKNLATQSQEKSDLVTYFDYVFPSVIDQDSVLDELMNIANKSGVYLSNTTFKENTDLLRQFNAQSITLDPKVESLILTINLEGSQQTLNEFLDEIESKSRIFNITSFNITRKVQQEISSTTPDKYYNLILTLGIYSYKDETNQ